MANSELSKSRPQAAAASTTAEEPLKSAPKPLTAAQNVILTIKILLGAAVLVTLFRLLDAPG